MLETKEIPFLKAMKEIITGKQTGRREIISSRTPFSIVAVIVSANINNTPFFCKIKIWKTYWKTYKQSTVW